MKFVRFGAPGREKPGILDVRGTIRDLSALVGDLAGPALLPESLARLRALNPDELPAVEGSPRLGPCVGQIGKIVGVGLNYRDHAVESGLPIPEEPVLFMKATTSVSGPYDDVEIPLGSEKTDWEVELGVVIGKPAKYVGKESALDHIAGYCIVNDVSERAFQIERGGQWDKGKVATHSPPSVHGW
jgi:2-keto-4-pentenoate hydratase/2-oxohepta-3-ene-1,7-dioic acid hydratase in catechol pathway